MIAWYDLDCHCKPSFLAIFFWAQALIPAFIFLSWRPDWSGVSCSGFSAQSCGCAQVSTPVPHVFFISTFFHVFFFNYFLILMYFFFVCRWPTHKCCQVSVLNTKSWPCHCSGIYESNLGLLSLSNVSIVTDLFARKSRACCSIMCMSIY